MDGNYGGVRDILWPRATTVVWLNYALPTVGLRALWRTIRRIVSQEPLWHDNRESFRRAFLSRESILVWALTTYRRRRREFAALRASGRYAQLSWIELSRPAEAEHFLRAVRDSG